MKHLWVTVKIFFLLTLVTGVIYPVIVTLIGQTVFPYQAGGSLVFKDTRTIGSALLGQKFVSDKYFWGRPSSGDYNPLPSGASNLGPTAEALKKAVQHRLDVVRKAHGLNEDASVPQDLQFASGSGLDPEISPEGAIFQVDRIAKSRGISDRQKLVDLIKAHVTKADLGFLGNPRVNVLNLNLALDDEFAAAKASTQPYSDNGT